MKYHIDTELGILSLEEEGRHLALYSDEAFELLSHLWLKVGWNQKYQYVFSWMGRPIIQIPEDMIRLQEVVFQLQPDVILETGIAHGGSLVYSASLCKLLGKGRVIGIDIDIRPPNRKAIEEHPLFPYITLIEGSSIAPNIVAQVKALIKPQEKVLALLDSDHTKHHVLMELEAYHDLIAPGSYIAAIDGFMKDLADTSRGKTEWAWDNPYEAALEFVSKHPNFVIETPSWPFNESTLSHNVTHWTGAWIKKASNL